MLFSRIAAALLSLLAFHAAAGIPYWEARRGDAAIYIVGEVHGNDLGQGDIKASVLPLVSAAEAVGVEYVMSRGHKPAKVIQPRTLASRISPSLWYETRALLAHPASAQVVNELPPLWAAAHLEQRSREVHALAQDGLASKPAPGTSWSRQILRIAGNKPRLSLDTDASYWGSWSACEEQGRTEELILLSIRAGDDPAYREFHSAETHRLLLLGDADGLLRQFRASRLGDLLVTCTVTGRNSLWLARINDHLKTHKTVVYVVGAAHLGGEAGLLALLQQDGFKVRRQFTGR